MISVDLYFTPNLLNRMDMPNRTFCETHVVVFVTNGPQHYLIPAEGRSVRLASNRGAEICYLTRAAGLTAGFDV
jgi:hypothetical protein